jgi:hypothetical protein
MVNRLATADEVGAVASIAAVLAMRRLAAGPAQVKVDWQHRCRFFAPRAGTNHRCASDVRLLRSSRRVGHETW